MSIFMISALIFAGSVDLAFLMAVNSTMAPS